MIVFLSYRLVLALGVLALVYQNFSDACEHENHHVHHDESEEHRYLRALGNTPYWVGGHKWNSKEDFQESGARCGQREPSGAMVQKTNEIVKKWVEEKKKNKKDNFFDTGRRLEGPINILTHFHVIRSTDGSSGDVSPSKIEAQLDVINNAYASSGFSFTMGDNTTTDNSAWYTAGHGTSAERDMKSFLHRGTMADLNVYLCSPGGKLCIWLTTLFVTKSKLTLFSSLSSFLFFGRRSARLGGIPR